MPARQRRASLLEAPETAIFIFAFLLNFVWEFMQVPLYEGMPSMKHWHGIETCAVASVGDGLLMLVAFWVTASLWRTREWVLRPSVSQLIVFSAVGVGITIIAQHLATTKGWSWGWAYAESMPVIPIIGTGLSPRLQWIVLPPLTVWFVRRHRT